RERLGREVKKLGRQKEGLTRGLASWREKAEGLRGEKEGLDVDVDRLRSSATALTSKNTELERERNAIASEFSAAKSQNADLTQTCDSLKQRAETAETHLSILQASQTSSETLTTQKLLDAEKLQKSLRSQVEALQLKCRDLRAKIVEQELQMDEMTSLGSRRGGEVLTEQVREGRKVIERLGRERAELQEKWEQSEEEVEALRNELEMVKQECETLRGEFGSMHSLRGRNGWQTVENSRENLLGSSEVLYGAEEVDALRREKDELVEKLARGEKHAENLGKLVNESRVECQGLRMQVAELQSALETKSTDAHHLSIDLTAARAEKEGLLGELNAVKRQLTDAKANRDQLQLECVELQREHSTLKLECESLKEAVDEGGDLEGLRVELRKARDAVKNLEAEKGALEAKLHTAGGVEEGLRRDVEDLKEQVEALSERRDSPQGKRNGKADRGWEAMFNQLGDKMWTEKLGSLSVHDQMREVARALEVRLTDDPTRGLDVTGLSEFGLKRRNVPGKLVIEEGSGVEEREDSESPTTAVAPIPGLVQMGLVEGNPRRLGRRFSETPVRVRWTDPDAVSLNKATYQHLRMSKVNLDIVLFFV
ncbi:hypothetical protein HK097_010263, partial [Rhizophlyctis rosea]